MPDFDDNCQNNQANPVRFLGIDMYYGDSRKFLHFAKLNEIGKEIRMPEGDELTSDPISYWLSHTGASPKYPHNAYRFGQF